jgi:hypothetical protein
LGSESALITGMKGLVLDLERGEWLELPAIPESPENTRRNLLGIPGGAVAYGGERWENASGGGNLLNDAWLWIAD